MFENGGEEVDILKRFAILIGIIIEILLQSFIGASIVIFSLLLIIIALLFFFFSFFNLT